MKLWCNYYLRYQCRDALSNASGLVEEILNHAQTTNAHSEPTLLFIRLSDKGLHEVPRELGNCSDTRFSHINGLELGGNMLSSFPFPIHHMENLQVLKLDHNHYTSVPLCLARSFQQLTRLAELDLSHNKIYELPSSLVYLVNLTKLDISHNRLLMDPESGLLSFNFSYLALLKSFSFSHNYYSKPVIDWNCTTNDSLGTTSMQPPASIPFPRSVLYLTNLTSLQFHGDKIGPLPDNFCKAFSKLEELDMGGNSITTLPAGFERLPLRSFNMSGIHLQGQLLPEILSTCVCHPILRSLLSLLYPSLLMMYFFHTVGKHLVPVHRERA